MSRPAWAEEPDGVRLFVRVTPRAKRSGFGEIVADGEGRARLSVRLATPPVDGAANKALVAFFSEALDVPRSAVEIVAGEASRLKTIMIRGASSAVLDRLA